jgi:hypothetical protein
MRTHRASWIALWVAIVTLPLSWGGLAAEAQQIVWIKFDDLPNGLRVDEDYAGQGVHFLNDYKSGGLFHRASPQITAHPNARSLPNVLVNDFYDLETYSSAGASMVIWFDQPVSGAGMWLGTIGNINQSCSGTYTATVSAHDCDGSFIAEKSVMVSSAFNTPLEIDDPLERIQKVVIDYGDSTCPEAIDDLAFQFGVGQCTDTTPPKVTITSHYDQVVTAVEQTIEGAVVESGILKSVKIDGVPASFHLSNSIDPAFESYWKFDEGSGKLAYDSVGFDHGTLVNAPVRTSGGRPGSAITFDGVNDYVHTTLNIDQSEISPGATMLMWVWPIGYSSGKRQVVSTDDGGWDWSVLRVGDEWQVFTGNKAWQTPFSVDQNKWQHLAVVFDPKTGGIRFYKNGQGAFTYDIGYDPNDNDIEIGRNPGGGEYFEGKIDEVAIYTRPLASDEIIKLYHQSKDGDHYFYPVHDATYYFSGKVTLKEGSNTITVLAQNGGGLKDSDQVTLTLGKPSSVTLGQFHLTQRGVMKNKSPDVDAPLVAGKSAIVRILLGAKTASGLNTYVSRVEMELWRKKQGGDELVDIFDGTTYSPFLSMFNSPNHMSAIHFWIPGDKLDPAGDYKFVFYPYVGTTVYPPLVAKSGGEYFTFTETKPVRLFILPVEAGLSNPNHTSDHVQNALGGLATVARTYPVRDGFSEPWEGKKTGLYYVEANPLSLCDGTQAMHQAFPDMCEGHGWTWRLIDKHPSGTLQRADYELVTDTSANHPPLAPGQTICGGGKYPHQHTFGGRITNDVINDPNHTLQFIPALGIFRWGAHPGHENKYYLPIDEDHDGQVLNDTDDLQHFVGEFYDFQTSSWMTDTASYDQGETYRYFQDQDDDHCNDEDDEPQADVVELWQNAVNVAHSMGVTRMEEHNKLVPGTQDDATFASLWFPVVVHPQRGDFGTWGPGSASGKGHWMRVTKNSTLTHELGHSVGGWGSDHDLYYDWVDPDADDLATKENAWAVYVDHQSLAPQDVYAVAGGDADFRRVVFLNTSQWPHYQTLFDKLKVTTSASAHSHTLTQAQTQFVASGFIDRGGQPARVRTSLASGLEVTPVAPGSPYAFLFGNASTLLLEYPVEISTEVTPPEGYDTWRPRFVPFHVVTPFPANSEWVELWANGKPFERFERSPGAPSVNVLTPNGGQSFGADDEASIRWFSDDPDGGEIRHTLYYSPDGGERWIVLATGVAGNEFLWKLSDTPGTADGNGLIRVAASDGFNTGEDQSDGPFEIEGKPPLVVILDPKPDQNFLGCERIHLRGIAKDPESQPLAVLGWYVDGENVSLNVNDELDPLPPGTHYIVLEATDSDGHTVIDEAVITVQQDSDCDGMSDKFEEAHGLEPGFVEDTSWDGDEDGLINLDEAWLGLDPTNPDTDGDGLLDGEDPDPRNPSLELVAYWKFDGAYGTTASDSSGNGNHGTLFGDPTWRPDEGKISGALDFDGDGDYVKTEDTTNGLDFAPGSFSVSAWINPREVEDRWRAILEYDRYVFAGSNWFGIWLNHEGGFHFRVGRSTLDSEQRIAPNAWHLVTATYDSTEQMMSVYVDGRLDTAWMSAGPNTYYNAPTVSKLTIGAYGLEDSEYFDGKIDDLRIYNRTLTAAEVAGLMAGISGECFPVINPAYDDWLALGKPDCWCWPYHCDGDADGVDSGFPFNYRVFIGDLVLIVDNWQKKSDDATLDPCADIDHKDSGFPFYYRVFIADLAKIVANWKKKDGDLAGNCPRQE